MPVPGLADRGLGPVPALVCCVLVAAGSAWALAPTVDAKARKHCTARVERVLAANRYERVYVSGDGSVLICDKATGTFARLADSDQTALEDTLVLRGRVTVMALLTGGISGDVPRKPSNTSSSVVRVVMPRDRRRSPTVPEAILANPEDAGTDSIGTVFVPRLLLATNQTTVLSTCTLRFEPPSYGCADDARIKILAVPNHAFRRTFAPNGRTVEPTSPQTTLAEGPGIDPESLRLTSAGRTVTWIQDGELRRGRVPAR